MRLREVIGAIACVAAAWPLSLSVQQGEKVYRIGSLWDGPDVFPDALDAFRAGLRDHGYVENHNLAIEYRWAAGKPELMLSACGEPQSLTRIKPTTRTGHVNLGLLLCFRAIYIYPAPPYTPQSTSSHPPY